MKLLSALAFTVLLPFITHGLGLEADDLEGIIASDEQRFGGSDLFSDLESRGVFGLLEPRQNCAGIGTPVRFYSS